MKQKGSLRAFYHTLILLLSLVLLVSGSICAEYNIRRTLGQPIEMFSANVWHQEITSWGERICWLLSPLGRAVVLVFDWECQLLS